MKKKSFSFPVITDGTKRPNMDEQSQRPHLSERAVGRAGEDLHPGVPQLPWQCGKPGLRRRRLWRPRGDPGLGPAHPLPFLRHTQLLAPEHASLRTPKEDQPQDLNTS